VDELYDTLDLLRGKYDIGIDIFVLIGLRSETPSQLGDFDDGAEAFPAWRHSRCCQGESYSLVQNSFSKVLLVASTTAPSFITEF